MQGLRMREEEREDGPGLPKSLSRKQVQDLLRRGRSLQRADLRGANLNGLDFDSADLRDAKLAEADLSGCNFRRADLRGASLWKANLKNVSFEEARLEGADMDFAQLDGATFLKARLKKTILPLDRMDMGDVQHSVRDGSPVHMSVLDDDE